MHVKDDGKGFDDTIAVEGNGLRNMKKRAGDIKAQLTIRSSAEGTIVSLIKISPNWVSDKTKSSDDI